MDASWLVSSACGRKLRIFIDNKPNMSQTGDVATQKTNGILGCMKYKSQIKSRYNYILLCSDITWEFCIQFWIPSFKKDIHKLECTHTRITKRMEAMPVERAGCV